MTLRNYSSTAAQTTLSAGVDSTTSLLAVSATTGFPAVPFILAVDAGAAAQELVLVTNVAGTNLTVTRGYDSTVAVSHDTGAVVSHSHGGIDFREANAHVNASSGVHGTTSPVVGTQDTQTLVNKTVALGNNTISGTKAQFNTALTDGDFATLDGTETLTNKTLTAPAATGSLANFGGAWTAFTPTVTATSGAPTTVTPIGAYTQVGKRVDFTVNVTITAKGTAAGGLVFTLPVVAKTTRKAAFSVRESLLGVGGVGALLDDDQGFAYKYDASTLWADGAVIYVSGTYEAA